MNSTPMPKTRTVIIAGGGTGGHIYPGVAIARALEKKYPDLKVHFVGSRGGLEEKIVPREKFPLHTIAIGKLHKSAGMLTRVKTLLQMPLAFFSSLSILRKLKPVAVLGVGGFASGPLLFVAALFGYRTLIWEPNAYPGLANRMLAHFVSECLLVFQDAERLLRARKVTAVGLPVRPAMIPETRQDGQPLRVLVFGGSQGARAINEIVSKSVVQGGDWLQGVELIHQTGALDYQRIRGMYEARTNFVADRQNAQVQVFEYLHDMEKRYAWADLVVCRSGASTVAEICACHKASLFIPLPTAADNHQQKNAEVLVSGGAAEMILQKDFTIEKFQSEIEEFRDNRQRIKKLEEKVRHFAFPDAAEAIVARVLDGVI